jgi:fructan beta-fructosidase
VSINPGGPNGGSATQYFIGDFDGKTFIPASTQTRWLDWGTDSYAAVTWSNTGERKILIGWMSNWQYANQVPTHPWRGANTIPRELALQVVEQQVHLTSLPVKELDLLNAKSFSLKNLKVKGSVDLTAKTGNSLGLFRLDVTAPSSDDFSVILSNKAGSELIIGYSATDNQFYIDRSRSGKVDFERGFGKKHIAPRIARDGNISFSLIADVASVELFADNGLSVMTDIFFPDQPMSDLSIHSVSGITLDSLRYTTLKSSLK